jgi:hypothetical protein
VQVKPRSGTQPVLHPVWFPLSHCSPVYNLIFPQTGTIFCVQA